MKKELKDYLHLYLGCQIRFHSNLTETWGIWNKMSCSDIQLAVAHIGFGEKCQIQLRPLSDMTEEERKELWEFVFNRKFGENGTEYLRDHLPIPTGRTRWVLTSGVERLGIQFNGRIWYDSDLQHWNFSQHEVTRWLLSRSFDLFDLIESGLAINKNNAA